MAIEYSCDRCKRKTTKEELYEVQVLFIPGAGEDLDNEGRFHKGYVCKKCLVLVSKAVRAAVTGRL